MMRRGQWAVCMLLWITIGVAVAGQETALMVTYGPEAPKAEGDDDNYQVIFFEIPKRTEGPLYVRLFDPDSGGRHDHVFGSPDTETRFALYAGPGAAAGRSARPSPEKLSAGTLLREETYALDPKFDNAWHNLTRIDPSDGEETDAHTVFKLIVTGTRGNDANVFDVAVSQNPVRNIPPAGLRIINAAPTFRLGGPAPTAEMRFFVPAEVEELRILSFDLAGARIALETAVRTIPLKSSGQGTYAEATVALKDSESGRMAALTLDRGGENPNDVVFSVTDERGRDLPIEWPVWIRRSERRLAAELRTTPLGDCQSVLFEASPTQGGEEGDVEFSWGFGDGGTEAGNPVVHRYLEPGVYRARLAISAASNPLDTVRDFSVTVNQAPVAEARAASVVAPGEEVRFDGSASRDPDGQVARYLWDFDDGERGTGHAVTHVYSKPGRYVVTLRVEDDSESPCNFATDDAVIVVNSPPVAEIGKDIVASVGDTITLDASRSYDIDGHIVGYKWDLGDGERQEGEVLEKVYSKPGEYTVILELHDDAGVGNSAASDRLTVFVNDLPIAEAGKDRRLAVGESTLFDASPSRDPDGKIVEYSWDFGNGQRGTGMRIPYAFHEPGSYTVTLSVRDNSQATSGIASDHVTVRVNAPPVAEAGENQVVTASEVRFDARASRDPDGKIVAYSWDFGDGSQGSGASPVHVYSRPGLYQATLSVIDDSGTPRNNATDTVAVLVNERPLSDAGPDRVAAPGELLRFTGRASFDPDGEIVAYRWAFGDGEHATGQNATHTYDKPGIYTVRLTVGDDTADAAARDFDEAIVRINAPPVAQAGPDVVVDPDQEILFDARTSYDPDGQIAAYRWEFSDGQDAAAAFTRRRFANPGVYTAHLTVVDDSGVQNGSAEDELSVRVNHRPQAVLGKDILTCDSAVAFDGSASVDADGDALTYYWNLGDGATGLGASLAHVYAEGGSYPVTLVVDDGQGLDNSRHSASMVVRINRYPIAVPGEDRTACAGEVVLFDGSDSHDPDGGLLRYRWDFGDETSAEDVNPTTIYIDDGTYTATLRVEDDSGLQCNSDTQQISVRVVESPTANAGPDIRVCANTTARFDGTASRDFDGVVNRYRWDFGDGMRGGGANPEHLYTEPGTYRVRLTVTGDQLGSCDNTNTDELVVKVLKAPAPLIDGPAQVPIGQSASFDGSGSSGGGADILAWQWDFGDGSTAKGPSVSHTWQASGRYPVKLTLKTSSDTECSTVSREKLVTVNQAPVAEAGEDQVVGVQQRVEFDGSGSRDEDGAIVSYEWDFGDGETASGLQVRHRYPGSGRYTVQLRVKDDADVENSSATDTVSVTVNAAPAPVIEVRAPACPGEETSFSAAGSSDADSEIAQFEWIFGDGQTASGVEVAHTYPQPGRYHLTLVTDDGVGVNNSRQQATLALPVNRHPVAEAGPDRVVCRGEEISFDGSGSVDQDGKLVHAKWTFAADGAVPGGTDPSTIGIEAQHIFEKPGLYTAHLAVTDDSGSSCAIATDAAVVRVNAPPLATAGPDREVYIGGAHDAVLFDASGSRDPDGDPLSYLWDLGDGNRKMGAKVYHTYSQPGRYTVRLIVRDSTGTSCGTATDKLVVEAKARQPEPEA